MKSKGKQFEADLQQSFDCYRLGGFALIEKVDPPIRVINRRAKQMPNPWLDFSGSWGGQSIHIEAKERQPTTKRADDCWLPIGRDDGLTAKQVEQLVAWGESLAVSFVLWNLIGHETRLFNWTQIKELADQGIDRLYWPEGTPVKTMIGQDGHILLDPLSTYKFDFVPACSKKSE